jgi:hypothetical protein
VIGTALDIMSKVTPPRAVFVDYPVGRTFGPPQNRTRNEEVLSRSLAVLPSFSSSGEIRDLHFQWEADGSRAWENELQKEMLSARGD